MTESLKHKPGILYFSSQLKFPEVDGFIAHGLLDIMLKVTGSLKCNPRILYFRSQFKFLEEKVF